MLTLCCLVTTVPKTVGSGNSCRWEFHEKRIFFPLVQILEKLPSPLEGTFLEQRFRREVRFCSVTSTGRTVHYNGRLGIHSNQVIIIS